MKTHLILVLVFVFGILGTVVAAGPLREAATDATSDDYAALGAAATSRTYTLTAEHWYSDTTEMVVSSDDDGDITASCTVAANRLSVACTGLTSATHAGSIDYITETDESMLNIVIKMIPFFVILGIIGSALGQQGYTAYSNVTGRDGGEIGNVMNAIVTILVMAILIPVVLSFVDMGRTEFDIQPEFIGMSASWTLVLMGYVILFLLMAFNTLMPAWKSFRD